MPAPYLHLLSTLAQLHTPRADPLSLLSITPLASLPAVPLFQRQWRRWRLLSAYWEQAGETLLAHALRRESLNEAQAAQLRVLARAARPPAAPELQPDSAGTWTALFVYSHAGFTLGDCRSLQLRRLEVLERFPPLLLSAQVHDASMLSAGNLALEALSHWLGRKLGLDTPFPLWLEAAFADDARLSDSSASLLLAAVALQGLFELAPSAQAFSGRVQRDTGLIQTVQGFDLPYGKLEAAFDAGVRRLFVPQGTLLNALPQAGVHLKYLTPGHYRYFLADDPDDQMEIVCLQHLDDLFAHSVQPLLAAEALQAQLQALPLQLESTQALPGLARWLDCEARWQPLLPPALQVDLTRVSRQFREAYEHSQAGAERALQQAAWQTVQQALVQMLQHWLQLLLMGHGSRLIQQAGPPAQDWMQQLQQVPAPLQLVDLLQLAEAEALQGYLQTQPPVWQEDLLRLLAFVRRLQRASETAAEAEGVALETLWQSLRYALHSLRPEGLLADLAEVSQQTLPLLQPADAGSLWFYGGSDAQATPVYLHLPSGRTEPRPGACPYLPDQVLQLERQILPCHRQLQTAAGCLQPVACAQPLEVLLVIQNSSEWVLPTVQLHETLPAGLRLLAGSLSWQGPLWPRQRQTLRYRCLPEQPGQIAFAPPEVQYELPAAFAGLASSYRYESPLLEVLAEYQAELTLQLLTAPPDFKTREPVTFRVLLENRRAVAATDLCWLQRPQWPAQLQLLGPGPELPQTLPPYGRCELSWQLAARWPGHFDWPALGLRYRPQPGAAWAACQLASRPAAVQLNRELPFTGRQAEWERLDAVWQDTELAGVYLWGPDGVGKQRLLQCWQAEQPRLTLSLQRLEDQGQSLLQALAMHWLPGQALNALSWPLLLQALQALHTPGTELLPRWLLLEQADRLDAESIAGLALLWQALPERLFFLLSGEAPDPPCLAQVGLPLSAQALQPLGLAETRTLLAQVFPGLALDSTQLQALWEQTRGLPLRLREYCFFLVQSGWLYCTPTGWQQQDAPLPASPSLQALARQELEPVLRAAEALAWLAAVLGPVFERQTLVALLPDTDVQQVLKLGVQHQIWGPQPGDAGHYAFAHALHRSVLLQLAGPALPDLHARVADWLVAQPGMQAERIARHYLAAAQPVRALPYLLQAARQLLQQQQYQAAADWLQQADPEDVAAAPAEERAELALLRGQVAARQGDPAQALPHLRQALQALPGALSPGASRLAAEAWLALAEVSAQAEVWPALLQARDQAQLLADAGLQAEVALQMGLHAAQTRSFDDARRYFYQALGHCEPQSLPAARVMVQLAYEAIRAGQARQAEQDLLQARLIFDVQGDREGLAQVYNRLGAACFYLQELERAGYYFSTSEGHYLQLGDRRRLLHVRHNLGLLAEARRDYAAARHYFTQNLQAAAALSDLRLQLFSHNQLGSVLLKLRQLPAAAEQLQAAEALLHRHADRHAAAYLALNQALLALLQQRWPLAERSLQQAEQHLSALQDLMGQDLLVLRQGHYYWLTGQWAAAENCYQRALASRQVLDARQQDGLEQVHHALALLAYRQGDDLQAARHLQACEALVQKRSEVVHYAITCHNLAQVWRRQGDVPAARQAEHKRNVLLGIAPQGVLQDLAATGDVYPMLD